MKYRRDIDGLRAIAVLPVMLFHAHAPYFSGGYVGVDIFFVISGYLITTIIAGELEDGTFSSLRFYERRARRILPALLLMVVATLSVSTFLINPNQLQVLGERALAVLFFVSNMHLALNDDYFDDAAETNPFLHTWSLAIEEQYYILFPILMIVIWKTRKHWALPVVLLISIASILLAEWMTRWTPTISFYLLPTRTWELGAGAIVALAEQRYGKASRDTLAAAVLPALGLVMIGVSIVTFDRETVHPGFWTLLPVTGAVLVLAFGGAKDLGSRFLSLRLLVGVGLISYSLYLWHQPLIAMLAYLRDGRMQPEYYAGALLVSFLLAWLTWKFVETPFRSRTTMPGQRALRIGGTVTAGILIFAVACIATRGFAFRKPDEVWRALAYERLNPAVQHKVDGYVCMSRDPEDACPIGVASGVPGVAVVGDSHAAVLGSSFSDALAKDGRSGVEFTQAGCPYVPGFTRRDHRTPKCPIFVDATRARLLTPAFDIIFLAGRYTLQLDGHVFDNKEGGVERGETAGYVPVGADKDKISENDRKAAVSAGYTKSVEELIAAGKRVVLIYPIPEAGWRVPRELADRRSKGDFAPLTTSYERYRERNAGVFAAFDAIPDSPNLVRVYPDKVLCNTRTPGRCETHDGDLLYYVDDDHMSRDGAKLVVGEAMRAAEAAWPDFRVNKAVSAVGHN